MTVDEWMERIFKYSDDHVARPNGVGDYDFFCSGVKVQFIPFLMRSLLDGQRCSMCHKKLKGEFEC